MRLENMSSDTTTLERMALEIVDNGKEFPNDLELAEKIVKNCPHYFENAPDDIQLNEKITRLVLSYDIWMFPKISIKFSRNKSFVMDYIEKHANVYLHWTTKKLKMDSDLAMKFVVCHGRKYFRSIPECFQNKKDFIVAGMRNGSDVRFTKMTDESVRDDEEIVKYVIDNHPGSFKFISQKLKINMKFINDLLKQNVQVFKYVPFSLKSNEDIVRQAIREDGRLLEYASDGLRSNKSIVMEALKCSYPVIKYVHKRDLLVDRELIFLALKNCPKNVYDLPSKLSKYKDIALAAVESDGTTLTWFDNHIRDDKEVVKKAMQTYPRCYLISSLRLRLNEEFSRYAIGLDGYNMTMAPTSLRTDRDVVLMALKTYPLALKFIDGECDTFRKDYDLVMTALDYSSENYWYASREIRNNERVVWKALSNDIMVFPFIPWNNWDNKKEFLRKLIMKYNKYAIRIGDGRNCSEKHRILRKLVGYDIRNDKELQMLEHGYQNVPRNLVQFHDVSFSFKIENIIPIKRKRLLDDVDEEESDSKKIK